MSDFTTVTVSGNTGTDASPVWGSVIAFGGTLGANEMRFIDTGAGGGTGITSALWPSTTRPAAGTAPVRELYLYTADGAGYKVATYDGGRTNSNVLRINFDNLGTMASAARLTAFSSTAHSAPVAGTQVSNPTDGANIINGANPDTGTSPITSYLKINAYGSGVPTGGAQETPAAAGLGTTLLVTSGTAGSVSPGAAAWLATWQSAQGFIQYITAPAIYKPVTLGYWYFSLALFMGISMLPGTMPFVAACLDYTYA